MSMAQYQQGEGNGERLDTKIEDGNAFNPFRTAGLLGGKSYSFRVACPQDGTAVLKG